MENRVIFKQLSSLEKVFLDDDYKSFNEVSSAEALKGERVSYQILYLGGRYKNYAKYTVKADERICIEIRDVGNVPSMLPVHLNEGDEYYLRKVPGLYPDVLYPKKDNIFWVSGDNSHSLFVTAHIPEDLPSGEYQIEIQFDVKQEVENETEKHIKVFTINVLDAMLPKQELIYTQWFHGDCIASYYNYEIFSQEHWNMIEKFIEKAVYTGMNMILTPIFTLPLDTEVGRERPTMQLVDVEYINGIYGFGFEKLKKWIKICKKHGVKYFEMSHLFSQWGTGYTPKIEVMTENGIKNLFGWHTKADSEEYRKFLKNFLPKLTIFLKNENVYDNTYFHISDEPDFEKHYEIYKTEKEMLSEFIPDEKIIDAMSHYEFYECGLTKKPVAITSAVDTFFGRGIRDIWTYYCCIPSNEGYSNRFISMPSYRNRIVGIQLYKYDIKGFLHWGYNFYNSQLSRRNINPFVVTDADEAYPSGDAFSVYPYDNGPIESIRSVIFYEAIQDLRACTLLENYIGRDEVIKIIEESGEIKFNEYPRSNEGVAAIRERINAKIKEVVV